MVRSGICCSTRSRSRAIISLRCSGVVVAKTAIPIVDAIALIPGRIAIVVVVDEAFGVVGRGEANNSVVGLGGGDPIVDGGALK